jgi:hypothetical protein
MVDVWREAFRERGHPVEWPLSRFASLYGTEGLRKVKKR